MNEPSKAKPWITIYDEYGDQCGTLAGDKEGLQKLKTKIDEAIANGESPIENDIQSDFEIVKLIEENPYTKKNKETIKDKVTKYGCLTFGAIVVIIFCVGLKEVFETLFTK